MTSTLVRSIGPCRWPVRTKRRANCWPMPGNRSAGRTASTCATAPVRSSSGPSRSPAPIAWRPGSGAPGSTGAGCRATPRRGLLASGADRAVGGRPHHLQHRIPPPGVRTGQGQRPAQRLVIHHTAEHGSRLITAVVEPSAPTWQRLDRPAARSTPTRRLPARHGHRPAAVASPVNRFRRLRASPGPYSRKGIVLADLDR